MQVVDFPPQDTLDQLKNVVQDQPGAIEWPNVIVTASCKKYEKAVPESAFSIFANKKGAVKLHTHKRILNVCEQTFYLCNPFDTLRYTIDETDTTETFNIHFNYSFYSAALFACLHSDKQLLDQPEAPTADYTFYSQLHFRDAGINQLFNSYRQEEEDIFLMHLLHHCLQLDHIEKGRLINIPAAKKSTRTELVKRMQVAKDYIYSHYNDPALSVKTLSKQVYMSQFHFLRTFKQVYGCSPYQYIKAVRIERARYLIQKTDWPVYEIAHSVGFNEASALFPVIKKSLQNTPLRYRGKNSNFQ